MKKAVLTLIKTADGVLGGLCLVWGGYFAFWMVTFMGPVKR